MLTRYGVCYNLENSPYIFKTLSTTFHFSSQFYFEKFVEEYRQHRKKIADSLSLRFNFGVTFDSVADIVLYSRIEKRGFYIIYKGVEFKCRENLRLHGDSHSNNG